MYFKRQMSYSKFSEVIQDVSVRNRLKLKSSFFFPERCSHHLLSLNGKEQREHLTKLLVLCSTEEWVI